MRGSQTTLRKKPFLPDGTQKGKDSVLPYRANNKTKIDRETAQKKVFRGLGSKVWGYVGWGRRAWEGLRRSSLYSKKRRKAMGQVTLAITSFVRARLGELAEKGVKATLRGSNVMHQGRDGGGGWQVGCLEKNQGKERSPHSFVPARSLFKATAGGKVTTLRKKRRMGPNSSTPSRGGNSGDTHGKINREPKNGQGSRKEKKYKEEGHQGRGICFSKRGESRCRGYTLAINATWLCNGMGGPKDELDRLPRGGTRNCSADVTRGPEFLSLWARPSTGIKEVEF